MRDIPIGPDQTRKEMKVNTDGIVEAVESALNEPESKLPPIGTSVDVSPLGNPEWYEAKVLAHHEGAAVVFITDSKWPEDCCYYLPFEAHEIRTVRDRVVEGAMAWLKEDGCLSSDEEIDRNIVESLYDAGRLKDADT